MEHELSVALDRCLLEPRRPVVSGVVDRAVSPKEEKQSPNSLEWRMLGEGGKESLDLWQVLPFGEASGGLLGLCSRRLERWAPGLAPSCPLRPLCASSVLWAHSP